MALILSSMSPGLGPAPAAPMAVEEKPVEAEPDRMEVIEEVAKRKVGRRRAHQRDGRFKGDDPGTPGVNEAWIESPEN